MSLPGLESEPDSPLPDQGASASTSFEGIIGVSARMRRAFALVAKVAPTDASVLITGETGTGKELFARAIHASSARAAGPLVKLDDRSGRFEDLIVEAHRGTLFLDEVGELSLGTQSRLLRVLGDRAIEWPDGGSPRSVDFRVVAATQHDLGERVAEGRFRADLLHWLKVVHLRLPPLRERGAEDILRLAEYFAQLHGTRHNRPGRHIPPATQQLLLRYTWPGNVRELSHAIESAVVLSSDRMLSPELFELEPGPAGPEQPRGDNPFQDEPTLSELERRYINFLFERHGGHRQEIARVAGIGRSTLWRRLKEMGFEEE